MENGKQSLEREGLGPEKLARDLAVFGGALRGESCATATFPAFRDGTFGEKSDVMLRRVVGGEVGRDEEVGWVVW